MERQLLIRKLLESEDAVVPALFKPGQFKIIRKLGQGRGLSENEKRYLRGNMGKKLSALERLEERKGEAAKAVRLLGSIGPYYITGLEALKHNGYGWYFDAKTIEVINTRVKGTLRVSGGNFKLIRVKSIRGSAFSMDPETGLKYAANNQILKDARLTKNDYVKSVWTQMLTRYGKMFSAKHGRLRHLREEKETDYEKFGV